MFKQRTCGDVLFIQAPGAAGKPAFTDLEAGEASSWHSKKKRKKTQNIVNARKNEAQKKIKVYILKCQSGHARFPNHSQLSQLIKNLQQTGETKSAFKMRLWCGNALSPAAARLCSL